MGSSPSTEKRLRENAEVTMNRAPGVMKTGGSHDSSSFVPKPAEELRNSKQESELPLKASGGQHSPEPRTGGNDRTGNTMAKTREEMQNEGKEQSGKDGGQIVTHTKGDSGKSGDSCNKSEVADLETENQEVTIVKEKCKGIIRKLKTAFDKGDNTDQSVIVSLMHDLSKSYISVENLQPELYRVVGGDIIDFLVENDVDQNIYKLATDIIPTTCKLNEKPSHINRVTVLVIYNALINFTDVSERICSRVCANTDFLDSMSECLAFHAVFMETWASKEGAYVSNVLGVLYNCSCWYANRQRLRDAGLIWILKRVIDLDDLDMKLTATLALAGILDEEESKFFKSETQAMEEMSKLLGEAMQQPERRCEGWSTQELAAACSRLAGNDVNKALLVNAGILDHLAEMCDSGNDDEKSEALGAIWALAFDETNRDKMVDEGSVVELIIRLTESTAERVRTEARNILWTLREELAESSNKAFQQIANEVAPKISHSPDEMTTNTKHVMISYNWGSKLTVFKVHEGLEKNGFRVWIDRNEMKGSIVDSIAEGVENAEVLLMCVSPKYKGSKYCRAEAEYAFTNDIDIVPLLLEPDYKPDGWLGLIKGAKKHFDFSHGSYFNATFSTLVKELGSRGKAKIRQEASILPEVNPLLQATPNAFSCDVIDSGHGFKVMLPTNQVKEWSCDRVQQWLKEHHCFGPSLKALTGTDILFLKTLREEAPEYFYNYLDTKLKVRDIRQLSKFIDALKQL